MDNDEYQNYGLIMDWIVWKISFIYYSSRHMGLEGSLEKEWISKSETAPISKTAHTILKTNLSQKTLLKSLESRPNYLKSSNILKTNLSIKKHGPIWSVSGRQPWGSWASTRIASETLRGRPNLDTHGIIILFKKYPRNEKIIYIEGLNNQEIKRLFS